MKYLISYQLDQIQQKGFKNIEFLLKEKKLTKLTNTNQVISLTDLWDSLCTACIYRFILLLSKKAESKIFVIGSVL